MPAAAVAIPVNPNSAAISATTKKIKAHFNILITSKKKSRADAFPRVRHVDLAG